MRQFSVKVLDDADREFVEVLPRTQHSQKCGQYDHLSSQCGRGHISRD